MTSALLKRFESNTGLLIIGHGSRNNHASKEFADLAHSIKVCLPSIPVEYGYLEFASPIISEALDRLRAQRVKRVIAIPSMLFAAAHAKNDIPSVLKKYSMKTGLEILYGRELGINNLMIGAAAERIKEVISNLSKNQLAETLLVVVGRGASDPDANSNVAKITRLLVEGFGFGWGETVFSGVTFPLVEPGLRQMVNLGFSRIIVFPYFLFSGVLVSRIRRHTKNVALDHPEIEFLNASYLGNHPLVTQTFLERIEEVFDGETAMNCSLCKYRSDLIGFESEVGSPQESHHHHFEGLPESCNLCENECTGECEIAKNMNHGHSHGRVLYPNLEHPFGPASLKRNTGEKI